MHRSMRGATLAHFADVAVEQGADPRALLRKVGIDPRMLKEPEFRLPAKKGFDLLALAAEETGCETFALRMASRRKLSDLGVIGLLLAHQPTIRDMFEAMIRYQRLANQAMALHIEDHPDGLVVVRLEILCRGERSLRQGYELGIASLFTHFSRGLKPGMRASGVHFTHDPPADFEAHRHLYGSIVEFGSTFNGLTCARADFDAQLATGDPALADIAEQFIRSQPYTDSNQITADVQKTLHVLMPRGGVTIATVADRLGMSTRTLQRRLTEEGSEFTDVLNEIRREHATRYLANARASLSDVAGLLGYGSEQSFSRWFSGEFGLSPSAWRAGPQLALSARRRTRPLAAAGARRDR